jgi:hypothetical protein
MGVEQLDQCMGVDQCVGILLQCPDAADVEAQKSLDTAAAEVQRINYATADDT